VCRLRSMYVRQKNRNRHGSIAGHWRAFGRGLPEGGYSVIATSRDVSWSFTTSANLVLIDGDIGKQGIATKCIEAAMRRFGTVDVLVNNAGIFRTKPFTDFTTEDFNALAATNLLGFLYITQLAVPQMLKQKSGNVVTISASLTDQPVAGKHASVSMMTKGGRNTVTRSLAIEYAKDGIRFNAVAPAVVDSPRHKDDPRDSLKTFQQWRKIVEIRTLSTRFSTWQGQGK
jgi:NAD(P)-dependent dehydrogenase (short-subunit alcohol dehydrogenase family)